MTRKYKEEPQSLDYDYHKTTKVDGNTMVVSTNVIVASYECAIISYSIDPHFTAYL